MPNINDRIGSQNVIRVLSNASAPPTRLVNLSDVDSTLKTRDGMILVWDLSSETFFMTDTIGGPSGKVPTTTPAGTAWDKKGAFRNTKMPAMEAPPCIATRKGRTLAFTMAMPSAWPRKRLGFSLIGTASPNSQAAGWPCHKFGTSIAR